MGEKVSRNAEGYPDPTFGGAWGNMRREEKQREAERMAKINDLIPVMKPTITNIANISVSRSTWGIEQFVQEALVHYAPQIYSYVYTDLRGNIRINKNAFEHPDEVIQFLPLILELDEGVEYAVYFGNTLTETFSFIRKQKPQEGYNITVRPVAEAEYINVTLIFKEESRHDEQKPD